MFTGSRLQVKISEGSPAWKYHEQFYSFGYYMQDEKKNQCKHWKRQKTDTSIWFSNNYWMIGDVEDIGKRTSAVLIAPASNDQWPTDLNDQWLYWNSKSKEWTKAGGDIVVRHCHSLHQMTVEKKIEKWHNHEIDLLIAKLESY